MTPLCAYLLQGENVSNTPPIAKQIPHLLTHHNDTRVDPYYWLRDDERSASEVLAHLAQENAYTAQQLASTDVLQQNLFDEMVARIRPDDCSLPYLKKDYWYQTRYEAGKEYGLFERYAEQQPQSITLLLDANERASGHDYYDQGELDISPNQQLLAFAEDFTARGEYDIRIKCLTTGQLYPEVLSHTSGNMVWANDNQTLFYVKQHPDTLLPYQVYRHRLDTSVREDVLVHEEQDVSFYTSIYKSRSEQYVMIGAWSTLTSEVSMIDADNPEQPARVFLSRACGHEYEVDHYQQQFYVRSNYQGANFGFYRAHEGQDPSQWQTLLPARAQILLESVTLFRDWWVIEERSQGMALLRYQHRTQPARNQVLEFADPAYVTWLGANEDPNSSWLRYGYCSLTQPVTWYEVNMDTQEQRLLKQQYAGETFDPQHYRSERIWITAQDNTQLPVSLVYRIETFQQDGTNPLLVAGYGAYGDSQDPDFFAGRLSLLDRGFVYAIAHVRGGEELGRPWYEQGRLLNKKNSFTDFIDITQGLIEQGYGNRQRTFAYGGSAGGLLVAAAMNMAPQLFYGVVAAVPFVDVLTTMLDDSLPLTTGEYDEWGDPNSPEFYHYIKSYSPYDQVVAQPYPHLLVTTGLHDSQVSYWEPAKWVAKLRELKTDDRLLLLHCDMDTGHGGKTGRFEAYYELAREYAFLLMLAKT